MSEFPGRGRKRPQLNIPYNNLFLDAYNPRLPAKIQGKDEPTLLKYIKKAYYLEELAQSMSVNGYLDEEPIVAIPIDLPEKFNDIDEVELKSNTEYIDFLNDSNTKFTVVEGNRRLSTVKLLLSENFSKYLPLDEDIKEDLKILPVIVYPKRDTVLTYLGVRHINPVRKWGAYEKARYIAQMIEQHNINIDEVQKRIGDTSNSARKTYTCYRLIELMEDQFEYDTNEAKEKFSFLMLSTGQGSIRRYIGLTEKWNQIDFDNILDEEYYTKLKRFFVWIYGDKNKNSIISESRDITGKLSPVLNNVEATIYLEESDDLEGSYERSDGDDKLLNKYLNRTLRLLDNSFSLIVDKGLNEEAKIYLEKIEKRIDHINRISTDDD
jgi:hypothetical protein